MMDEAALGIPDILVPIAVGSCMIITEPSSIIDELAIEVEETPLVTKLELKPDIVPDIVDHELSPLKNVEDEAPVPEARFAIGKLPVTSEARFTDPVTIPLPLPLSNPFKAKVIFRVPAELIGLPDIPNPVGTAKPTDVTVPPPPGVAHEPSPLRNVVDDAVPVADIFAMGNAPVTWLPRFTAATTKPEPFPCITPFRVVVTAIVPLVVIGPPDTPKPVGIVN